MSDVSEEKGIVVHCKFHSARPTRRREFREGTKPPVAPQGSVPRVARLLALALHYQGLLDRGEIEDLTGLAELAGVTKARMTQIMNLNFLAPDIQEEILDLPRTMRGRDPIRERQLRAIAKIVAWEQQREAWGMISRPEAMPEGLPSASTSAPPAPRSRSSGASAPG